MSMRDLANVLISSFSWSTKRPSVSNILLSSTLFRYCIGKLSNSCNILSTISCSAFHSLSQILRRVMPRKRINSLRINFASAVGNVSSRRLSNRWTSGNLPPDSSISFANIGNSLSDLIGCRAGLRPGFFATVVSSSSLTFLSSLEARPPPIMPVQLGSPQ